MTQNKQAAKRLRVRAEMLKRGIVGTRIAASLGVQPSLVTNVLAGRTVSRRVVEALVESGIPEGMLQGLAQMDEEQEMRRREIRAALALAGVRLVDIARQTGVSMGMVVRVVAGVARSAKVEGVLIGLGVPAACFGRDGQDLGRDPEAETPAGPERRRRQIRATLALANVRAIDIARQAKVRPMVVSRVINQGARHPLVEEILGKLGVPPEIFGEAK